MRDMLGTVDGSLPPPSLRHSVPPRLRPPLLRHPNTKIIKRSKSHYYLQVINSPTTPPTTPS